MLQGMMKSSQLKDVSQRSDNSLSELFGKHNDADAQENNLIYHHLKQKLLKRHSVCGRGKKQRKKRDSYKDRVRWTRAFLLGSCNLLGDGETTQSGIPVCPRELPQLPGRCREGLA